MFGGRLHGGGLHDGGGRGGSLLGRGFWQRIAVFPALVRVRRVAPDGGLAIGVAAVVVARGALGFVSSRVVVRSLRVPVLARATGAGLRLASAVAFVANSPQSLVARLFGGSLGLGGGLGLSLSLGGSLGLGLGFGLSLSLGLGLSLGLLGGGLLGGSLLSRSLLFGSLLGLLFLEFLHELLPLGKVPGAVLASLLAGVVVGAPSRGALVRRGLELVAEGILVRGDVAATGVVAVMVGDAVDGAIALDVGALGVAVILGDAAPDHGTGLEAGEPLVGALDDVDVAALVVRGAHLLALRERLLGVRLGLRLSLGLGGVFLVDASGEVVRRLLFGSFLLGNFSLHVLVHVPSVVLLVLGPLLAVEVDGGVDGRRVFIRLWLGLRVRGLIGVGVLNLGDGVLADGVLEVVLEELGDVDGLDLGLGFRGRLLEGILVGLLVDGKDHRLGLDVVGFGRGGAHDANLGLVDGLGHGDRVAAGAEEGHALVLAGVVRVASLGAVLSGEIVTAAADLEAGGFRGGLARLLRVARDHAGRGFDVEERVRLLLGLDRGHVDRLGLALGVDDRGGDDSLGHAEASLAGSGRHVFPGVVDVAGEVGRSRGDGELLERDDVGEGVLPAVVGGVVPRAEDDVAVGALARLALAGAEKVERTAVQLASLDILHENVNLAPEAVGEGVGRGSLGVELLDERVGLQLIGLGVLELHLDSHEFIREVALLGFAM